MERHSTGDRPRCRGAPSRRQGGGDEKEGERQVSHKHPANTHIAYPSRARKPASQGRGQGGKEREGKEKKEKESKKVRK